MKRKVIPYTLLILLVLGLLVFILMPRQKSFNEKITLHRKDKIPYGGWVAHELLPKVFPHAQVKDNREPVLKSKNFDSTGNKQLLIVLGFRFNPNDSEITWLSRFVENGNYVLVSTYDVNDLTEESFKYKRGNDYYHFLTPEDRTDDSLTVSLLHPPYSKKTKYFYPGKRFDRYFTNIDSSFTYTLGHNVSGWPDVITMKKGNGMFLFSSAPITFSNYFLLYGNNVDYYKQVLSVFPNDIKTVVWDEYFYYKREEFKLENRSPWRVLLSVPAFKSALLLAIAALAVYFLLEVKRKKRYKPRVIPPVNDSLDFVKTIGRLYYGKKDNLNICQKMSTYFLEHVRTKYNLPTHTIDENFVTALTAKSGWPQQKLKGTADMINFLSQSPAISDSQLAAFYESLNAFYKNT